MQLTHDHEQIRDTLKRYIDEHINPHVDEWEEAEIFPAHQVFKDLGNLGLLGLTKPVEYGGMGLDYSYSMVMAETLGLIRCGGVPMAIGVQTDMCTPALARFGSDELKREFLAPAIAGDMVGCIGVSEPGAGSDVAGIKSVARKDGDDYVIRGQKMWITSSDTGLTYVDEARVPQRHLMGVEGQGFIYQMQQFQEERLWAGANALLALDGCIRETIDYARQRQMFGATLLDQQWVQFKLVELQTEVEALRALTWAAGERYIAGDDVLQWASMAKLKAGRLTREVADTCLQFWGGMGFTLDNRVSRLYRDGRLASIGGGADEVMMGIIAKTMGMAKR